MPGGWDEQKRKRREERKIEIVDGQTCRVNESCKEIGDEQARKRRQERKMEIADGQTCRVNEEGCKDVEGEQVRKIGGWKEGDGWNLRGRMSRRVDKGGREQTDRDMYCEGKGEEIVFQQQEAVIWRNDKGEGQQQMARRLHWMRERGDSRLCYDGQRG